MIVRHIPSEISRIDKDEVNISNLVNLFIVKLYFIPSILLPISYFLFVLKMLRFAKWNISLIKKVMVRFKMTFDKKYISKMDLIQYLEMIIKFGHKATL